MALGPRPQLKTEERTPDADGPVEGDERGGAASAADTRDPGGGSVRGISGDGSESAMPQPDLSLVKDFDALFERYNKPLFNVIHQWIGNYDEAVDLAQDTWVAAYDARENFRGDSQVYTWLFRIAHNRCKNRFKQRDRQREMEGDSLDAGWNSDDTVVGGGVTTEVADWSYSPSRLLEEKERSAAINRAIDALASEYRIVLILREMEGLSYSDIAEVTGLSMEAVKTRLNRARNMVQKRVEPYFKI